MSKYINIQNLVLLFGWIIIFKSYLYSRTDVTITKAPRAGLVSESSNPYNQDQ